MRGQAEDEPTVYISSTARDLGPYRSAVLDALRRLGCRCVAMEDYGADSVPPLDRCITDVLSCDVYVGIVAWSYGFTPPGGGKSFVMAEYEAAKRAKIPTLIFLVREDHPWSPAYIDRGPRGEKLDAFRATLKNTELVDFFTTPDDLAVRVSAAVGRLALRRRLTSTLPEIGLTTELLEAYQEWVIDQYGYVELVGVGAKEIFFPLSDIFVTPELRRFHSRQSSPAQRKARTTMRDLLAYAAGTQGVVIVGEPGSGKTTLLLHLLESILQVGGASLGLEADTLPVFASLRKLSTAGLQQSLPVFLQSELDALAPSRFPDDFVQRLWQRGRIVLLLDGLDEVGQSADRTAVVDYLRGQAQGLRKRGIKVVLSCRSAAYAEAVKLGPRFHFVEVLPLDAVRTEHFVQRWFDAADRLIGSADGQTGTSNQALREELIGSLRPRAAASQNLAVLTSSPLMLSLLCVIALRGGEVPQDAVDFYRECLRTLLGRWSRTKGIEPPLSASNANEVLRYLAFNVHNAKRRDFDSAEFANMLAEPLRELMAASQDRITPQELLEWFWLGAGVLTRLAPDTYGFTHLTLQEFLTASYLADDVEALQRVAFNIGDKWWREVFIFTVQLASRDTAAELFTAVLRPDLLSTACATIRDCIEHVDFIQPKPFVRFLEDPVTSAWSKADVLRMFVNRRDSEIIRVARSLAHHRDPQVASLAARIVEQSAGDHTPVGQVQLMADQPVIDELTGIVMLPIPPGEFIMGSLDVSAAERPPHTVRISRFWLAETSVTNRQYEIFLQETHHAEPAFWREPRFAGPELPIVGVNWYDALEFCRWLSTRTGLPYTLPSEAQWEYAARSTDGRRYPWGNEEPDRTRACYLHGDTDSHPEPVGSFPLGRGPFGCLDQAGNVWEWCLDMWDPEVYGRRVDETPIDPIVSTGLAAMRVLRGGNWWFTVEGLDASYRFRNPVDNRNDDIGFRVALNEP
ncbi:MAG: SUMF1/EgtB/PvdO family nonheme iron enzyme [Pseudonocardiaceae bacterium]